MCGFVREDEEARWSRYWTISPYGLFRKDYKSHPKERKRCMHFKPLSSENEDTVDVRISEFVQYFDFDVRETTFEILDERISQAEIQKSD